MSQRAGSPQLLRRVNDAAALRALLAYGPATRLELETLIGLSKPATADLLLRLESDGQVRRAGLREGGKGPKAQLWSINGALAHVAAVDLTPHALDVAVADLRGEIVGEHRVEMPSPRERVGVTHLAPAVAAAAAAAGLRPDELRRVVVGLPGGVDPRTGQLGFAPHLPDWGGFDVLDRLRAELGTEVAVENDVNLVALDEMAAGRAVGFEDFVLIWIDEGVGAAVVSGGRLLRGAFGGAGELDFMPCADPVNTNAPVGGVARVTQVGAVLGTKPIAELARIHGLGAGLADALADPASAFFRELARRVALPVAGVVAVVDPELVVLSGEIGRAGGRALCDRVAAELSTLVVSRPAIEPSQVGGNPVRAGALRVALSRTREDIFAVHS